MFDVRVIFCSAFDVRRSMFDVRFIFCSAFDVAAWPLNIRIQTARAMSDPKYDLEERLLEYSASIVRLVEQLSNTRAGNHVAGQLLRSGTCLLYTSPSPRDGLLSRMPSSA